MSDSQLRTSLDGYRLSKGAPCSADENSVRKRERFIYGCLTQYRNRELRILEIGCGYGVYLQPLSKYASTLIGIDINEVYLKEANTRIGKAVLMLMSAEKLAFEEDFFDIVLMMEVLEHISDDQKSLSEIYRVLKPGGKLILTAPNKMFPFETHGIRVGQIQLRFPLSLLLPFSPTYPIRLRKIIANARVYSYFELEKMLIEVGLTIKERVFLMPSLDTIGKRFGFIARVFIRFLRWIFRLLEKSSISMFGSTILIYAEKFESL